MTETKFSGPAFWAFLAGEDRQHRICNMREARRYLAGGYSGTARLCVEQARMWNRYLVKHVRLARGVA
jgi:hypothetical protein